VVETRCHSLSNVVSNKRTSLESYRVIPGKSNLKHLKPTVWTKYEDAAEEITESVAEESDKSQDEGDDSNSGSNF
jgi:hypothetical protein